MVELRVTIDEKLNKILRKQWKQEIYKSKAELMRSATIYFLIQMGILKERIQKH